MFAQSAMRSLMPPALFAAAIATSLPGAAQAGSAFPEPTHRIAKITTSGLDLANPVDVAKLDKQINAAARKVCAPQSNRDLAALAARAACEKAAVASGTGKRDVLIAQARAEQIAARAQQDVSLN